MSDDIDTSRLGIGEPAEGYRSIDWESVTIEDLEGAPVYDRHDERIATVEDVVVGDDGRAEAAVMNVGTFLGLGGHTVAVDVRRLGVRKGAGDVRVYLSVTEDELRSLPPYAGRGIPPATTGFPR
jgi:hypothetical protein